MMMHDASMKSYYISAGEMNMDWIEVKATCMWCMSKVVQSKLDQVRISITFDMHHMLPPPESNLHSFNPLLYIITNHGHKIM